MSSTASMWSTERPDSARVRWRNSDAIDSDDPEGSDASGASGSAEAGDEC